MSKDEGRAKDLVEKFQRGELTSEEALRRLEERKLTEGTWGTPWKGQVFGVVLWIAYFALWLPLSFLFSDQMLVIRFPMIVIYICLALVAIGTLFLVPAFRSHKTRGGLKKVDEAIVFCREGPYRIMRHPQAFGGLLWPILLPVILSVLVPFTYLSIAAIIIMIIYLYSGVRDEEKLDIEKWGDEYRQYIKEVPRFNFILGLWRARKRRNRA